MWAELPDACRELIIATNESASITEGEWKAVESLLPAHLQESKDRLEERTAIWQNVIAPMLTNGQYGGVVVLLMVKSKSQIKAGCEVLIQYCESSLRSPGRLTLREQTIVPPSQLGYCSTVCNCDPTDDLHFMTGHKAVMPTRPFTKCEFRMEDDAAAAEAEEKSDEESDEWEGKGKRKDKGDMKTWAEEMDEDQHLREKFQNQWEDGRSLRDFMESVGTEIIDPLTLSRTGEVLLKDLSIDKVREQIRNHNEQILRLRGIIRDNGIGQLCAISERFGDSVLKYYHEVLPDLPDEYCPSQRSAFQSDGGLEFTFNDKFKMQVILCGCEWYSNHDGTARGSRGSNDTWLRFNEEDEALQLSTDVGVDTTDGSVEQIDVEVKDFVANKFLERLTSEGAVSGDVSGNTVQELVQATVEYIVAHHAPSSESSEYECTPPSEY